MEPFKESQDFKKFTTQLNKDLITKDLEDQQRKRKKYQRDLSDYKTGNVFKRQSKLEEPQPNSIYSTPEREVKIQDPTTSHVQYPTRWDNRESNYETTRFYHNQYDNTKPYHDQQDSRHFGQYVDQ